MSATAQPDASTATASGVFFLPHEREMPAADTILDTPESADATILFPPSEKTVQAPSSPNNKSKLYLAHESRRPQSAGAAKKSASSASLRPVGSPSAADKSKAKALSRNFSGEPFSSGRRPASAKKVPSIPTSPNELKLQQKMLRQAAAQQARQLAEARRAAYENTMKAAAASRVAHERARELEEERHRGSMPGRWMPVAPPSLHKLLDPPTLSLPGNSPPHSPPRSPYGARSPPSRPAPPSPSAYTAILSQRSLAPVAGGRRPTTAPMSDAAASALHDAATTVPPRPYPSRSTRNRTKPAVRATVPTYSAADEAADGGKVPVDEAVAFGSNFVRWVVETVAGAASVPEATPPPAATAAAPPPSAGAADAGSLEEALAPSAAATAMEERALRHIMADSGGFVRKGGAAGGPGDGGGGGVSRVVRSTDGKWWDSPDVQSYLAHKPPPGQTRSAASLDGNGEDGEPGGVALTRACARLGRGIDALEGRVDDERDPDAARAMLGTARALLSRLEGRCRVEEAATAMTLAEMGAHACMAEMEEAAAEAAARLRPTDLARVAIDASRRAVDTATAAASAGATAAARADAAAARHTLEEEAAATAAQLRLRIAALWRACGLPVGAMEAALRTAAEYAASEAAAEAQVNRAAIATGGDVASVCFGAGAGGVMLGEAAVGGAVAQLAWLLASLRRHAQRTCGMAALIAQREHLSRHLRTACSRLAPLLAKEAAPLRGRGGRRVPTRAGGVAPIAASLEAEVGSTVSLLRQATVQVAEAIVEWRGGLQGAPPFAYADAEGGGAAAAPNYLLRMAHDLDDLAQLSPEVAAVLRDAPSRLDRRRLWRTRQVIDLEPATQQRAADDGGVPGLRWAPIAASHLRRVRSAAGSVGGACLFAVPSADDEDVLEELSQTLTVTRPAAEHA